MMVGATTVGSAEGAGGLPVGTRAAAWALVGMSVGAMVTVEAELVEAATRGEKTMAAAAGAAEAGARGLEAVTAAMAVRVAAAVEEMSGAQMAAG